MTTSLTSEQILALAPDAGSAKNGQSLSQARHWVTLGCDDNAAWGECKGSGSKPYQVQVELSETAFRCSCPSRKFPCKHGLGLLLLLASQPQTFKQKSQPAWVSEWLESRAKRAEKREQKAKEETVADPAAQARRAAERITKVTAGLNELETWLRDLVRSGLANAQTQPPNFWETPARRMIDAQAPGVARWLRELPGVAASGEGWQSRLLERCARLHLLLEGFRRIDSLPVETQADIRALIGWTINQDELLTQPGVRDHWLVLGQKVEEEEKLRVQSSWLSGAESGRKALLLHFAHATQPLDTSLVSGMTIDAELVFFPGAFPMRALVREKHSSSVAVDSHLSNSTIAEAIAAYAAALSRNPWLERFPFALQGVVPLRNADRWSVRDASNDVLPIAARYTRGWELLSLSGGHPIDLFGEWNGEELLPLSVCNRLMN